MSLPAPVVTGLAFIVALGVLVFVHELGHFTVAKRLGVKVLRFSIGFGPILFARRRGETEYAISAMPLGGYVKMLGEEDSEEEQAEVEQQPERAFSTQPLPRRSAIVFAGPAMNFLFAFVAYLALFVAVGAEHPSDQPRVGGVSSGSPAERGGLEVGDRVLEVDGTPIATWEQLAHTVRQSDGVTLHLVVERDGARVPLEVTPELRPAPNLYGEEKEQAYLIGIAASQEWERVGPLEAVPLAAKQTVSASLVVVQGLALMIRGRVPLKELGGPIAIASAAGQQARAGARYFVSLLAFLSINLGILNLLPIPALDGGHLALFGVEAVLGRPLRRRHREIAQQVGILLLLTLMVFVFYNDINRLVRG